MKAGLHLMDLFDPAIAREKRVESSPQSGVGPTDRSVEADSLTCCMDAGIGAARGMRRSSPTKEALQNSLEFALNRAAGGLALPPDKAGAVIVQRGEEGPAHRPGI
jgi:hypothetical protein